MAESIIAGAIHWHLPDFHRTAETFLNMTRRRTPQSKRRKARTANQCTFCGKEDQQNLRTCSLCKSAFAFVFTFALVFVLVLVQVEHPACSAPHARSISCTCVVDR